MTNKTRFIVLSIFLIFTGSLYVQAQGAAPGGAIVAGIGAGMGGPPAQAAIPEIDPSLIEVYKTIDGIELSAHIFYPENHSPQSSAPSLIYFHGGGLRRGSPTQGYELAEKFVPEGVVVISPQYRLLGTNATTVDQLIADAKSLVRWVRANANRLGVDPEKIVASGHSAGGYLTMTTGVIPGFDEYGENLTVSSAPNALVLWSSFSQRRDDPENSIIPQGRTAEDFSVPEFLPDTLPPALFIHGAQDPIASPEEAIAFEARYREAGNQAHFKNFEDADHFFREEGQKAQVYNEMSNFMSALGFIAAE